MLGRTYRIGPQLNNNDWLLNEMLGNGFEVHIFNVLSKELEKYYDMGVKIEHTPKSRDHGKDIIIESPISLEHVLGKNFPIKDRERLKIYIECKSSEHEKIPYNSFSGNLSRIKNEHVGYYVLVTNTTIVPFSYYQFKEDAANEGIEFILIDQYLLRNYLTQNNAMIGNMTYFQHFENIYVEYQANSCMIDSKDAYELYFWIRNYSDNPQTISMEINTDRNWNILSNNIECIIDSKDSHCLKLIVKKEYFDGIDDLILNIRSNAFDTSIQVKGLNISYNFKPELIGEQNKQIISSLKNKIIETSSHNTFFLIGEAGVGKTRIIDEILSQLMGRNINFARILVEKSKNVISKLKEELLQTGCLCENVTCFSLKDILTNIDTKYRKCVIIVDDLHNASTDFLDDIRKLLLLNFPPGLTFLFIGRNDFSVGSIDYFSFLQFLSENYSKNIFSLNALKDTEAIQLIKSIVRGVPQIALERIHSLSNNLPLFIIQVIEYMLDLKLVYLLNRNTVGIENIDSFSSHMYIPKNMEEIYDGRIESLLEQNDGEEMLKFLYIASFIGTSFSDYVANIFFENKESLLRILLERRYIICLSNSYAFAHESLYLYIQNRLFTNKEAKKEVGNWLTHVSSIFDRLNHLKKGQLNLWIDNKDDARLYFSSAISEINDITNYSSININQDYYNYLDDIYTICPDYKQKKQIIACKIYIALHYHTPYEAVLSCSWAQKKLQFNKLFQEDLKFRFYLKEQMAHSYLNAGQLKKSELILVDLLSETIVDIESCDKKAMFDMYDKLSNLYIKYNSIGIAHNYCKLSLALAKELNDLNLQALSYISTAKLYFYTDRTMTKEYLIEADKLLSKENSYRIKCHNDVSFLIMNLMEIPENDRNLLKKMVYDTEQLLKICIENNFTNSVIRLYMLAATQYYLLNQKNEDFSFATKYLESGIDASIKFGISTYIWQFYNLAALISVREKQKVAEQSRLFDTVFNILNKQNLTYLGKCNIVYGNMLALTNIMIFYRYNKQETLFYQKISQISFADSMAGCDFNCNKPICQYECHTNLEIFQKEWERLSDLKNKQPILFGGQLDNYPLQDSNGYYIILS